MKMQGMSRKAVRRAQAHRERLERAKCAGSGEGWLSGKRGGTGSTSSRDVLLCPRLPCLNS